MKNDIAQKIKNAKPFEKHDVIVYAVLALFVLVLFFSFVILPKSPKTNGFIATKNNQTIVTYSFDDDFLIVEQAFKHLVQTQEQENSLYIKIFAQQNSQKFNLILVNKLDRTVDVIDANCSTSAECVHMPKISGSGAIFCAPHSLSITCGYIPPIVG